MEKHEVELLVRESAYKELKKEIPEILDEPRLRVVVVSDRVFEEIINKES